MRLKINRSAYLIQRKMESTRRNFLGTAAVAVASRSHNAAAASTKFHHRGYLGWITDIDSRPEPHAAWPSIRLDENLVSQYRETCRLMQALGYNESVVWGLYVGRDWPVDIPAAISAERARLVLRLIDSAHHHGLRLIAGLGVFSWGFEELIRTYPALGPTNPRAMCASNPDAWHWMEKIIDFALTRLPVDGVSMQSADQGRCTCVKCSRFGDAEYHARINIRAADYIRSRHPGKLVAVSGWGMKFDDAASLPFIERMAAKLDYLIDVSDTAGTRGRAYRRDVIRSIRCDFGTIGGMLVEPPLHWQRDRWFLPTARAQGEHLSALAADGGRACEYFCHIRANPGDEVSFYVAGKLLSDIATPWQAHLRSTLADLYRVEKLSTLHSLEDLFVRAEAAYMSRIKQFGSGDISLEPLVEDHAGPPIYIIKRMPVARRRGYSLELDEIAAGFRSILRDVPEQTRIPIILRCIENVQHDLQRYAA